MNPAGRGGLDAIIMTLLSIIHVMHRATQVLIPHAMKPNAL